jgi:hypothetical protein
MRRKINGYRILRQEEAERYDRWKEQMRNKDIERLNLIEIEEVSSSGGEIEYILIDNNLKNIKALIEIGLNDRQYQKMMINDEPGDYLDITEFAFGYLGANYYSEEKGFEIRQLKYE